jgi:hypothetical protein
VCLEHAFSEDGLLLYGVLGSLAKRSEPLQRKEGDVVLLLPALSNERIKLL